MLVGVVPRLCMPAVALASVATGFMVPLGAAVTECVSIAATDAWLARDFSCPHQRTAAIAATQIVAPAATRDDSSLRCRLRRSNLRPTGSEPGRPVELLLKVGRS